MALCSLLFPGLCLRPNSDGLPLVAMACNLVANSPLPGCPLRRRTRCLFFPPFVCLQDRSKVVEQKPIRVPYLPNNEAWQGRAIALNGLYRASRVVLVDTCGFVHSMKEALCTFPK